jgi:hypothetical protein
VDGNRLDGLLVQQLLEGRQHGRQPRRSSTQRLAIIQHTEHPAQRGIVVSSQAVPLPPRQGHLLFDLAETVVHAPGRVQLLPDRGQHVLRGAVDARERVGRNGAGLIAVPECRRRSMGGKASASDPAHQVSKRFKHRSIPSTV